MSCQYRKGKHCETLNDNCPFMKWCDKLNTWVENDKAGTYCKYMQDEPTPEGYCKVEFARHGYLYVTIDVGESPIKIENPFDDIPKFVKVNKTKSGYKLKR